jgi:iron complex outermembrane receptor protein
MIVNDIGSAHINSASRIDNSYKRETYDDRDNAIGLGAQYNEYRTVSYGYNQFFELPTKYNIVDTVIDLHKEDYSTKDILNVVKTSPSSRNFYSLSAEDKVLLFSGNLIISPAFTFEYYDNNFDSSSTPRNESHGYLNPKVGLRYALVDWLTLKTNVAKYIREPSFFELFGDRGLFVGNSDLKAERGVNFDIGPEFNYAPYDLYLNKLSVSIVYFRNSVNDVISYVYNSRGVGQAVNISNSTTNGLETDLKIDLIKHLSFTTNYTWQSAMNENAIKAFNGKKLPGRFEHSVSTRLEGKFSFIKPYYEFLYASGLFYDSANLLPAPIKREHNLGIAFLIEKFTITAEVKNIGDDHYQDFNGYPTPGRSYWLTANYSF